MKHALNQDGAAEDLAWSHHLEAATAAGFCPMLHPAGTPGCPGKTCATSVIPRPPERPPEAPAVLRVPSPTQDLPAAV